MIKRISSDGIREVAKYIWSVYKDETKRTTPPYESEKGVALHLSKCLQYDSSHLLGVFDGDILEGIVLVLENETDCSVNVQGPYINDSRKYPKVALEMLDYLTCNFKGFKCYVGTTKPNVLSQEFFEAYGFECTDDTIQMCINKEGLVTIEHEFDIRLLSEEYMDAYKDYHDRQYYDYYWLADRIYDVIDRWKVHILLEENQIVGSVFAMKQTEDSAEIYGCKILDSHLSKKAMTALFYSSTKSWMDEGISKILNFVPEGLESECAELVGYRGYDTYMCFYKDRL